MRIRRGSFTLLLMASVALVAFAACAKKAPPVARPVAPPASTEVTTTPPPPPAPPTAPVRETPVTTAPATTDPFTSKSVDDLNREAPLKAVYFEYDLAELTADARASLDTNAGLLKRYGTWVITIEGHCDERGTAEYNLALGERRAAAAQSYLVSLGVPAERLRTVSYGKEFPFDPGHDEAAYAKNRRAHFVITAK